MTRTFESGNTFEYGAFLTLCNRFATLILTILALVVVPRSDVLGSAPIHEYSVGAYTNLISSMAQYLSLDYVSFPLLVLSKSCKMPPVMLLGYLVHNKSYKGFEYTSAMLVLMGTFFFLLYDDDKSQRADAAGRCGQHEGNLQVGWLERGCGSEAVFLDSWIAPPEMEGHRSVAELRRAWEREGRYASAEELGTALVEVQPSYGLYCLVDGVRVGSFPDGTVPCHIRTPLQYCSGFTPV